MSIKNIIDNSQFPLKKTDTVEYALNTLSLYKISLLPVVNDNIFIGFIDEKVIKNQKPNDTIFNYITPNSNNNINENLHHSEALKYIVMLGVDCLVVLDNESQYVGIISRDSILKHISESYTINAEGTILTLEIASRNYSLNELNRIIENEDAKIIGLTIYKGINNENILVNIKLNTIFTERIMLSLQRFGYQILESYNHHQEISDIENRYHSLIKYLEL